MVIVINKNLLISFLIVALLFSFSQAYAYTEITDCTTITEPGEYRLTQDIIDTGVSVCIDIQSDNVVFDCQGHILDQTYPPPDWYGIGINIDSRSNVTIKNCVLGYWSFYNIYSYHTSNVRILNSTLAYSTVYSSLGESEVVAIYFERSDNCYVDNITSYGILYIIHSTDCYLNNLYLSGEHASIDIEHSSSIAMRNIKMINTTQGISIISSDHINVTNSYISGAIYLHETEFSNFNNIDIYGSDHSSYGMYIDFYSNSNNFTNITISNFRHEGIWLGRWSFDNIFTNVSINNIVGEVGIGVYVWKESNGNYFKGLTIRNALAGIFVDYFSAYNVFEDFTISDITGNGIWLRQVQDTNEFKNGRIQESNGNGIRLEDTANQVFHGIIIKNSDNCGISLWSSGYIHTENNLFYDNIFMNRNNTCFEGLIYPNYWNTTLKRGKNILGGPFIGGNFWGRPDGKSILDELKYAIKDGIYDHPYDLLGDGSNVDYHPLAVYVVPSPPIGLGATARAIAQINPLAVLIFVLMPVIIGEFLIRNFEEIKANEPLKAAIRLLIIITALALFALAF
jgi:hypothetical protein